MAKTNKGKQFHPRGIKEAARILFTIKGLSAGEIASALQVPYRTIAHWRATEDWDKDKAKETVAQAAAVAGINLVLAQEKGSLAEELERLIVEQLTEARNLDPRVDALVKDLESLAKEKGDSRALGTALWALTRKHGLHLDMVKAVASLVESVAKLREAGQNNEAVCPACLGKGPVNPKCPLMNIEVPWEEEDENAR